MEAGEGRDSLSAERHPGRRSPKSDGAVEIKTMPSGDNRMDTAFWEINVSDNSL